MTQSRSSINYETLQESLDAGGSGINQQYETPGNLARERWARLPVKTALRKSSLKRWP
jgi:hypothetical protein